MSHARSFVAGFGAAALALTLAGCQSGAPTAVETNITTPTVCAGVEIVIDYDLLGANRVEECVAIAEGDTITASEALGELGITTEGTADYGDAVICRIDGQPSATEEFTVEGEDPYLETCATMPPAFAYWAMWISTPDAPEWAYAMEGVTTQLVGPGDALGFMFSTAGATPTPAS
ncbi:MAG: hypothetical protein RIS25_1214 [Actinomycetota bacterium]|jgi:hypothetical protein